MTVKEASVVAYNNIKGKKKTGYALAIMMFFALFIYLFINSVALSVNNVVTLFDEIPIAKNIIYKDKDGELVKQLENIKDDVEHVVDVYQYVYPIPVSVEGIEVNKSVDLEIRSYSDNYDKYIVKGKLPEDNEILLPHYMFATEEGKYVDASKFIGEELSVKVTNYLDEEEKITLVVSGTYDNIYSVMGTSAAFVDCEEAIKIYDLSREGIEKKLAERMEETGNYDESHYIGYEKEYYYAVVVDDAAYINEVRTAVKNIYDLNGNVEFYADYNVLETVFPMIHLICIGISIALFVVVIIIIMSMVGNDINARKKEMSIYLVQGYIKKDLLKIISVEYFIRLIPVLICAVLATMGTLFAGNIIIETFMSMEYKVLELNFAINGLFAAIIMVLVIWFMAIYTVNDKLNKINMLNEIKSEG